MNTLRELALRLTICESVLQSVAHAAPRSYRTRKEKKLNGGFRLIEAPNPQLKAVQRKLLHKIVCALPCHPMLYGGPNSSTRKAALIHRGQPLVMTLDI